MTGNNAAHGAGQIISNTIFRQQVHLAIGMHYQENLSLIGNTVLFSTYLLDKCILIQHAYGDLTVTRNAITGEHFMGVYLDDFSGHAVFTNNMISLGQAFTNYPYIRTGVNITQSNRVDFYSNNIFLYSTYNNNADGCVRADVDSLFLFNNNLYAMGLGDAIITGMQQPAFISSDYNNFISQNGTVVITGNGFYTTLNDWIAASGNDVHSLSISPQFYSVSDLHQNEPLLRGAGTPVAVATTDFDGDLRNVPPDIGADETVPAVNDIALFSIDLNAPLCAGSQPVPFG